MKSNQVVRFRLGHLSDYTAIYGRGVVIPQAHAKRAAMMNILQLLDGHIRSEETDRAWLVQVELERQQRECEKEAREAERRAFERKVLALLDAERKQLMDKLEAVPAQMVKWLKEIAKIDKATSIIRGC